EPRRATEKRVGQRPGGSFGQTTRRMMPSLSLRTLELPRGSHRSVSRGATSIAQKSKRPVGQAILREMLRPLRVNSLLRGSPWRSVVKSTLRLRGLPRVPADPHDFLKTPFFRRFRASGGLSRAATPKVASGRGALFSPRRATAGHGEKSWTQAWVILRSDNPARDAFPQSAQDEVAPRIAPVSFSWRDINRSEEQKTSRVTERPVGQAILRDDASSAPSELLLRGSPWFSVVLRGAPWLNPHVNCEGFREFPPTHTTS